MRGLAAWLLLAGVTGAPAAPALRAEVVDDMADASAWHAVASDQVQAALRRDADGSLCLDYDFAGVSGYAVMRRRLPMDWPARFDLALRYKGSGERNDFQFKLADAGGDNVWWMNRPDHALPRALSTLTIRSRHIGFAWGPAADRRLAHTESIEFAVAAGHGGRGSLCVARLELRERAPDPVPWPEPVVRRDGDTLTLDLGAAREFNGLVLRWPAPFAPASLDYDVLARDDAAGGWRRLRSVRGGAALATLFLPESEARALRIERHRGRGLPEVEVRDAAAWPKLDAAFAAQAAALHRGEMPRAFVGEQNYWTLFGVDGGGGRSGLVSEDGAVELGRGGPSVEPSVRVGGTSWNWSDVAITHDLVDRRLPMPRVHWRHPRFTLDTEVAADGDRRSPRLLVRYRLRNTGAVRERFTLQLALRPWQVNPPQQFLATPGGARENRRVEWRGGALLVDGRQRIAPTVAPRRVTALALDAGFAIDALAAAPPLATLDDPQAHASAMLAFDLSLAPGEARTIGFVATLDGRVDGADPATFDRRFDAVASAWRARLGTVGIEGPAELARIADSLQTAVAQMLMSREGPALRPGTRSYARTWIRDGAMMVEALLRMGEADAARDFVDDFSRHLFASGKVPCCVDARGADPVEENDSHGEYLFAVAEVWRHTGDRAFLERHWASVQRTVSWIESLRGRTRTEAFRTPGQANLFGLLPPSISHEGYSDKPAYSYWDDFWALRGYKDAVAIAAALGHRDEAARWQASRDAFERELAASIAATARRFGIDHVAGAADRGDFDATSTTVALDPAQARVDPALLRATFDRYCSTSRERAAGRRAWRDYTPYEWRTVGSLVRLGDAACAHAMIDFLFRGQRPAGWNQWAEVVLPDPREPRFLGDMPHAWVASDMVRSSLDLLAYERESDGAIVVGAGLRASWLRDGDIGLHGLSTSRGRLDYRLARGSDGWTMRLERAGAPVRLRWPDEGPLPVASDGEREIAWQGRELPLPAAPSTVHLRIRR